MAGPRNTMNTSTASSDDKHPKALESQPASLANWVLHPAYEADDAQVRELFEQVFGHSMSQSQWQWKYTATPLRGSLLRKQGGEAVAFFGGMSRRFMYQGREYLGVQNGDVMVRPDQRAVFSRRGALYQVAAHFFGHHVGPRADYAFAFGFPSQRHFDLGTKLGLYEMAGRLLELRWEPRPVSRHWNWRWDEVAGLPAAEIDGLWQQMQDSWPAMFLPVRDGARWNYRYRQRPEIQYTLLLVRSRWTRRPLAALALRCHGEHVEWLDYVGPAAHLRQAVEAAREFAQAAGQPLVALVGDAVADAFAMAGCSSKPSPICVPVNASSAAPADKPWLNRLWLMGGDSDFM